MITLFIDTSKNTETIVSLDIHGSKHTSRQMIKPREAQRVLELLDNLLKEHTLTLTDIAALEVVEGPGSFTGLRVGVSVANTLAKALNIPINGGNAGEAVEPHYS